MLIYMSNPLSVQAHADYIDHDGEIIFPDIGDGLIFRLSDENHNCSIFDIPESEEATTVISILKTTVATTATATEAVTAAQTTNKNCGDRKTSNIFIFGLLATHITLTLYWKLKQKLIWTMDTLTGQTMQFIFFIYIFILSLLSCIFCFKRSETIFTWLTAEIQYFIHFLIYYSKTLHRQ